MINNSRITSAIYWDIDNNLIIWSDAIQHMTLLTKITLGETKTMDIHTNKIMRMLINIECLESGNISL